MKGEIIASQDAIVGKVTYETGQLAAYSAVTHGFKGELRFDGGINYSHGPCSVGGGGTLSSNSGVTVGVTAGYTKDSVKVGGSYDYNPHSGSQFGGRINYSHGPCSVDGGVTLSSNSSVTGGVTAGYTKDSVKIGGSYTYNPH